MQGVKSDNPVIAGSTITIALTPDERDAYIRMARILRMKNSALGRQIIVAATAHFFAAHEQNGAQIKITEAN